MEKENNNMLITEFKRDSIGTMRTSVDQFMHPLFCLKDACLILGIKNVSDAKKRLKSEGIKKISVETPGGVQNLLYVSEPNLYRLIFQSRKEEAQAFMDWVVEDILPSIRRIGRYDVQSITGNTETAMHRSQGFLYAGTKLLIFPNHFEKTLHQLVALILEQLMATAGCDITSLYFFQFHSSGIYSEFCHGNSPFCFENVILLETYLVSLMEETTMLSPPRA